MLQVTPVKSGSKQAFVLRRRFEFLGALLVAGLLLTVYTESLREFFDFTSVETTDWIIVLTAVGAALAGQWALSRYWQQFLDILTAAPRKNERLRGRAV